MENIHVSATEQALNVTSDFAKIATPARILIAGPTMCGKSHLILQLIRHRDAVFSGTFERIIYCLPEHSLALHQRFLEDLRQSCDNIEIQEGLPDLEVGNIITNPIPKLLVLDDLMDLTFSSRQMLDLMTRESHHASVTVIVTSQNYYAPAKFGKTFVRQCSEKIIFWDKSDGLLLRTLSSQVVPGHPKFFKDCFTWIYKHLPKEQLKYILIDSSMLTKMPHQMLVRTCIVPAEGEVTAKPIFFFPDPKEVS
jgi:hypothetical protein